VHLEVSVEGVLPASAGSAAFGVEAVGQRRDLGGEGDRYGGEVAFVGRDEGGVRFRGTGGGQVEDSGRDELL
jgi:hypothetical protein